MPHFGPEKENVMLKYVEWLVQKADKGGSQLGFILYCPPICPKQGREVCLELRNICFCCRIQTYLQSTKPIIDLYEEMGKVKKIDASKSVDEVSIRSLPGSKVTM